jgi:hypothetical protein
MLRQAKKVWRSCTSVQKPSILYCCSSLFETETNIRWQRPTKLEEFLINNEIHWSVPDWMYGELGNFENPEEHK